MEALSGATQLSFLSPPMDHQPPSIPTTIPCVVDSPSNQSSEAFPCKCPIDDYAMGINTLIPNS